MSYQQMYEECRRAYDELKIEADKSHELANHNFTIASNYERELKKLKNPNIEELTPENLKAIYAFLETMSLTYDNYELHLAVEKLRRIVEYNELDK